VRGRRGQIEELAWVEEYERERERERAEWRAGADGDTNSERA